jgi:hypothetical protein
MGNIFFRYGMMGGMMPDGSIVGPDGTMIPSDPSMMAGPMVKEIIHCKSCTLFPPNLYSPSRPSRPVTGRTLPLPLLFSYASMAFIGKLYLYFSFHKRKF